MQILYLGRALCTKETLPDFREKCRVTRHSRVFRGLTGSQRTPGFWDVTEMEDIMIEIQRMTLNDTKDVNLIGQVGGPGKIKEHPNTFEKKIQNT